MRRGNGFTLIEILVVVAILGVLVAIAVPSYESSIRKSRRTEAKEALLGAAALQERYFLQNNNYTDEISQLGGESSKEGYYTLAVAQCQDDTACYTFTITATAQGAQAKDAECVVLSINHIGQRAGNDGAKTPKKGDCW